MDDLSAELISGLLREDLAEVQDQQKGKQVFGNLSDVELAVIFFEEELIRSEAIRRDRQIALRINDELQDNKVTLATTARGRDQALKNRQHAPMLPSKTQIPISAQTTPKQHPAKRKFAEISTGLLDDAGEGTSKRSFRQTDSAPGDRRFECIACLEMEFGFDTVQIPCTHRYCVKCIIKMFKDSLSDESLFPPKCCREAIDLFSVRRLLEPSLVRQFEEKETELRDSSRTYCANTDCSSYIPLELVNKFVGTCRSCLRQTCVWCKKFAHNGRCLKDPETEKVLAKAKSEKWQRCYKCYTLVELKYGCFHIT